jgi:hypothetical protein
LLKNPRAAAEESMRRAWQALIAAGAVSVAAVAMPAAAREFPYCIKGCDFGAGAGDCSFSSLAQCQATASGRDAYCGANPYFNARTDMQTDRNRQQRRF